MTAKTKRESVIAKYNTLLGRNRYSQKLRSYVFKKYKGAYYSDCSSSIAACYRAMNLPITYGGNALPNTVGMYRSGDLTDVDVIIKNGIIQNPEVLRVGDLLLFAGSDSSRAYAGYVGHVEMVHTITGGKVTICGHGSGTPRKTELNTYCKSRYNRKADTKLGHRGLIRVRRRIQDDEPGNEPEKGGEAMKKVVVTGNTVNIRSGAGTDHRIVGVARKGDVLETVTNENGFAPVLVNGELCWISEKYIREE